MSSLRLTQIGIGMVSLLLVLAGHPSGPAAQTAFPNTVQLSGFTLGFPDGWSTIRTGSTTILVNVPAGQAATLTAAQFMVTPQIHVSTEQRTDGQDAARRLTEIAAETADAVTSLTIGGWPAIQRRHLAPWPQLGHGSRWKLRSRMAARRSGRRAALTLETSANFTAAPHAGQESWVVLKTDIFATSLG